MAVGSVSSVVQNSLQDVFHLFSKFGDTASDGKNITLTQVDKWLKQAGIIDGKRITHTDTGICFNKLKQQKINFNDFMKFMEDLAHSKKLQLEDLKQKLIQCGPPGMANVTQAIKGGAVDRLTDPSQYTGTHKERFDEKGKGKGKEGREDIADDSGYVQGYHNKDTYDKTHK